MKTKAFFIASLCMLAVCSIQAQSINRHLYFHIDFAAGNVYTAAFPSVAAWGLNQLTHTSIFGNALEYSSFSGEQGADNLKVRNYNMMGFTANELFQNIHPSVKLGWYSASTGSVNVGVYATAEYQQNLFKSSLGDDNLMKNTLNRALFGGSLFLVIGNIEKDYKVIVEGGARYSMNMGYKGPLAGGKKDINNGLTSHWAIKLTGAKAIQDFGIYADFNHFDLLKDKNAKLNNWSVGLMWAITPGQNETRNDIY